VWKESNISFEEKKYKNLFLGGQTTVNPLMTKVVP
jgi:hypothetical protein